MASAIGADLRSVGVHQGLAPVLDVVRDARWGRVEETAGEDPYLVGTITTAYVEGLQSAGVVATLKHLVGYSASRAGRNLAPVSMGTRERADVMLPPFEMAVRAGARSVMHAYTDTDGVPSAADESLLTGLLRDDWGFEGTVVADYFGIGFLHLLHGVAGTWGEAATAALTAGVDVEPPTVKAYGEPLLEAVRSGAVDEVLVDRALRRVLTQKAELGLLDPDYDPTPPVLRGRGDAQPAGAVDLDGPVNRALAREVAERSVVLLRNAGVLPLRRRGAVPRRLAVVGPNADTVDALLGCYSFPLHVGVQHPDVPVGIEPAHAAAGAAGRAARGRGDDGAGHRGRRRRDRRHRGGGAGGRGRRRRRGRARRPVGAVRAGHQRRGLRRSRSRAAGRAAAACSTRSWRPAPRSWSCCSRADRTAWAPRPPRRPPSWRRSCPARRGPVPSPAC
ncbi:hypothetical protein GCM10025868_22380 [Angustibacter aerolatus]|uniref:Glycoside hydrolase family 3 N-terminal domain-containing protein n=1 Tax=Angustibacter aerolatus TaxID=1162965 RepID=A0ABQ6JHX5_9ACTN|nr:hypothetical protein GCM10025868_22380 [Angustibacter aerolatus]